MHHYNGFAPLDICYLGPPLEQGPMPSLFYFALSAKESLSLDPYNQLALFTADDNLRIFSVTLPGHGPSLDKHKAMDYWANNIEELSLFILSLHELMDHLLKKEYILKSKIVVSGLSRGGFIALHMLAHKDINFCCSLAPITDLSHLKEFEEQVNSTLSKKLSLQTLYPKLIGKEIRLYIGNRDQRVSTRCCFAFIEELTNFAYDKRIRSPKYELFISPSTGHLGHGTLPPIFQDAAYWIKNKLLKYE